MSSGMKGVAFNNSPQTQPASSDKTILFVSLLGISGTGGVEATAGRKQRRDE